MSNRHIANALGQPAAGNIEAFLKSHNNFVALNDGKNFYDIKQIEPESQMPAIGNKEIEVKITDNDFDVTQIHDSFLTLHINDTVNTTFPFTTTGSAVMDKYLLKYGLVLKSGSNYILDYTVYHDGTTVTNTLQNDATIESYLYNVYKPRSEKDNRKHVHSLYKNVHSADGSYCGDLVSLDDIVKANKNFPLITDVSIPLDDILAFSGADDYPNGLFGELKIKFRVNPSAFVFCQVDPQALYENAVYMGKITGFDNALKTLGITPSQLWDNINTNLLYTRAFTQCGVEAEVITTLNLSDSVALTPMANIGTVSTGTFRITNNITERCIATVAGYKASDSTMNNLRSYYSDHVYMMMGQRVEQHQFATGATSTGLKVSQNIPLNHVTDLCVLFPTHSEDITTFINPHYKDLVLNLLGRNIPNKPVNTTDAQFFQQMLNASDLDSLFEATQEYETSLTLKLNSESERFRAPRDNTSFVFTCQVERSGGTGIFFDGLDTKGQNTTIELRGNPIHSGASDIYYNVNTAGTIHPPPPILCCVQDTFFWCKLENGRPSVKYEINADIEEFASLL